MFGGGKLSRDKRALVAQFCAITSTSCVPDVTSLASAAARHCRVSVPSNATRSLCTRTPDRQWSAVHGEAELTSTRCWIAPLRSGLVQGHARTHAIVFGLLRVLCQRRRRLQPDRLCDPVWPAVACHLQ
jgi:hypothetical protein